MNLESGYIAFFELFVITLSEKDLCLTMCCSMRAHTMLALPRRSVRSVRRTWGEKRALTAKDMQNEV
jgi:hypothetical protein